MDAGSEVGEVKLSSLQMEGESKGKTPPEHKVAKKKGSSVSDTDASQFHTLSLRLESMFPTFYLLYVLPVLQYPTLCDSLHASVHDKENCPMMKAGEDHVSES